MIRKLRPEHFRLYSHTGQNLGTFRTLVAAKRHERAVNYFKHQP